MNIPKGWKLVPVEPTEEMLETGSTSIDDNGGNARWADIREAWADMLAAAPTPKGYTQCRGCRDLTYIAEYESMPRAEWDGKAMLYSEARDQYYITPDDAAEDLEEDQTLADLRLVICEPNYVRQLEPDYFCDDLPEDGDVPDDVAEAMEAFNKAVAGIVLSWSPGKKALAMAFAQSPEQQQRSA